MGRCQGARGRQGCLRCFRSQPRHESEWDEASQDFGYSDGTVGKITRPISSQDTKTAAGLSMVFETLEALPMVMDFEDDEGLQAQREFIRLKRHFK